MTSTRLVYALYVKLHHSATIVSTVRVQSLVKCTFEVTTLLPVIVASHRRHPLSLCDHTSE